MECRSRGGEEGSSAALQSTGSDVRNPGNDMLVVNLSQHGMGEIKFLNPMKCEGVVRGEKPSIADMAFLP
jgi:hypothetical protein